MKGVFSSSVISQGRMNFYMFSNVTKVAFYILFQNSFPFSSSLFFSISLPPFPSLPIFVFHNYFFMVLGIEYRTHLCWANLLSKTYVTSLSRLFSNSVHMSVNSKRPCCLSYVDVKFPMKQENISDIQPNLNLSHEHLKNASVSGIYPCEYISREFIYSYKIETQ